MLLYVLWLIVLVHYSNVVCRLFQLFIVKLSAVVMSRFCFSGVHSLTQRMCAGTRINESILSSVLSDVVGLFQLNGTQVEDCIGV